MNIKGFFVTALTQALELSIATPDDVLRHVTPELLSTHLPRPLWARLLTACLGAPRVDAQLVVETIGVPNLCEHIPVAVIWGCLREIAQRSLGQAVTQAPTHRPFAMSAPPPVDLKPPAITPTATPSSAIPALAETEEVGPARSRTPTGQRLRQPNMAIGRLAANRRPQVMSAPEPVARTDSRPIPSVSGPRTSPPMPAPGNARRPTEGDFEIETDVGKDDVKASALLVEEDQFVEWAPEETVTHGAGLEDASRKR